MPSPLPCALGLFSLLVVLPAALPAQSQSVPTAAPAFAPTRFEGLFVDAPDREGALWARGTTYKIGFEQGVARYVPLFGPRAPRSFPIALELRAVRCGDREIELAVDPLAHVDGNRVRFERGAIVEAWDLAPEAAEQSFVLEKPLGSGDLVFELALETELALWEARAAELRFGREGLGEVRYGDAVAIDAAGRHTPLELELALSGSRLEIRVSAACAASAAYPLVVDPVFRTFAVDTTGGDTTQPDVAYDATHDVWLVVSQEVISGNDGDIKCRRFSGDGTTLLDTVYAESSSVESDDPAVANNKVASTFLVGWIEFEARDRVMARERHAENTVQENEEIVDTSALTTFFDELDLGGASGNSNRFLLTYATGLFFVPAQDADISYATYAIGGTVGSPVLLTSSAGCAPAPRVTKDSGPHRRWMITWDRTIRAPCIGGDIRFAIIDRNGAIEQNSTLVGGLFTDLDVLPTAAGDGESFFIAWQRFESIALTVSHVFGARIGLVGGAWDRIGSEIAFTQLEPGASLANDQSGVEIGFDGCRYVYAYSESTGAANPRPFAATFIDRGTSVQFHEGHVTLSNAAAGVAHSTVRLATKGSGGGEPGPACIVWQQIGNGGRDIGAALLDIRATTGGIARVATQCPARSATTIACTDVPALGRAVRIELGNVQGTPLLFVGLPSPPLTLCGTALNSCDIGVALPAILTLVATNVSFAIPCDLQLLGGTVAVQGLDLGASSGCSAALFGFAFRVTDTLNVTVQ